MNAFLLSARRIVPCLFAAACLLPTPLLFAATSQTITFNAIPAQTVGSTLTVSATASSGLPVTFTLVQNGNCSISGTAVTFLNVGNCGVIANQAGNATYAAAPAVGQIVVVNAAPALKSQTITFGAVPSQIVGGTLTVSATASSGLPVTFSVIQNGNCSISGNTVTFLNVGNCGIVANQAGNSTYAAAQPVGQIAVVNNPTQQTITFPAIAAQKVGTPVTLSATATSGLAVTYSSSTAAVCSVSGTTATFTAAGTCTLTASQSGNNVYAAAPSVSQSFTVSTAALTAQTITFPAIATQTVGTPLTISATATSALAVTFASGTGAVCTVSGTTATFLAAGTCTLTASQSGNATYAAATPVTQSFTVASGATFTLSLATSTITLQPGNGVADVLTVNPTNGFTGSVTISITGLPSGVGNAIYPSNPTTSSTNLIVYVPSGTAPGSYPLTIIGVSGSLTVTTPATLLVPGTQTISFPAIAAQVVGTPLPLSATASSGLSVTFSSSTTAVCTASGTTATFITAGTCTITAAQPGNTVYTAAPPVSQSFTVTAGSTLTAQTITFANPGAQAVGFPIALTATASSGLAVTLSTSTPSVCTLSGTAANFIAAGTCTLSAAQPGNTTYAAATTVTQSFNVTGTAAPVSAYFTICQAQPTTGSYCTDATPGPADGNGYHSLPYWTNLNKLLTSISVADNQVWGVDSSGILWFLPNFKTSTTWTQVATNVAQVSAGHNLVCQLSGSQHVLCATTTLGSSTITWFDTGATNLKQIAASAGSQLWAVDTSGNLLQVKDYTQLAATSTLVASGVAQVAVDGRGVVCQLNTSQTVSCSNWSAPSATANPAPYYPLPLVQTTKQLTNIAIVEGQVLGTDSNGDEWLLQDWANSATWFRFAYGGAGTVMAGASIPSHYLAADFAPGEVPVLFYMGQSNSAGYNELLPRFISPASPNVWSIQNAGWNYLAGNQNGTSPQFTNAISSISSVQWTNFNINPTGTDFNLGWNYNVNGTGPSNNAADFTAYQWQGLINAGWPLPDLYIVHIAWPGEGLDPTDNQGSTAGIAFAVHGLALWQPTLTTSQQPSYALAPFARTIIYRALQNLLASGKTPRLLGLQWNQWETDAEFAQSIADAPTNYNNLFSGFTSALGTNFPIQLVRPLSTNYGTTQLAQMQTVFANLAANDPIDFSIIDVSTVSPNIFSGGVFGGGDGAVHYTNDTQIWFAHQSIATCLLNANCGTRITSLPASPPN
jgi:hypothetical protein